MIANFPVVMCRSLGINTKGQSGWGWAHPAFAKR